MMITVVIVRIIILLEYIELNQTHVLSSIQLLPNSGEATAGAKLIFQSFVVLISSGLLVILGGTSFFGQNSPPPQFGFQVIWFS